MIAITELSINNLEFTKTDSKGSYELYKIKYDDKDLVLVTEGILRFINHYKDAIEIVLEIDDNVDVYKEFTNMMTNTFDGKWKPFLYEYEDKYFLRLRANKYTSVFDQYTTPLDLSSVALGTRAKLLTKWDHVYHKKEYGLKPYVKQIRMMEDHRKKCLI